MPPRKNLGLPKSPRLPEPAVATKTATSTKIILTIAMAAAAVVGFTYIASGFALVQQIAGPTNDQLSTTALKKVPTKSTTTPQQAVLNQIVKMYQDGELTFKYANDCQDPEDQPYSNNPNIFLANDITALSLTFYTKTTDNGPRPSTTTIDWATTAQQLNDQTPVPGTVEYCPITETPADDTNDYFCVDEETLKKLASALNTTVLKLLTQSMSTDENVQKALSNAFEESMKVENYNGDVCSYLSQKHALGCYLYGNIPSYTCPNNTTCVTDKDNPHYNACGIPNDVLANMNYREDLKGVIQAVMAENSIELPERDSLQWQLGAMLSSLNVELPDPQFTIGDLKTFLNNLKPTLTTDDKMLIISSIHQAIRTANTNLNNTLDSAKDLSSQKKTDIKNKAKQMVAEIDGSKIETLKTQLIALIESIPPVQLSGAYKAILKTAVQNLADAAQQKISDFSIDNLKQTAAYIAETVKTVLSKEQYKLLTQQEKKELIDLAQNSSFVPITDAIFKVKGFIADVDAQTTAQAIVDQMRTAIAANKKLTPAEKQNLIDDLTNQIKKAFGDKIATIKTNIGDINIDPQKSIEQLKTTLQIIRAEEVVKTKIVTFANNYTRKTLPVPAKIDLKSLIIKTKEYIQTLSKEDVKQALLSKLAEIQTTADNAATKWQTAKDKAAAAKVAAKDQLAAAQDAAAQAKIQAEEAKTQLETKIEAWKAIIEEIDYSDERATAKEHAETILIGFADTIVNMIGNAQDIVAATKDFIAEHRGTLVTKMKEVQDATSFSCIDKDVTSVMYYPGGDPTALGTLEYTMSYDGYSSTVTRQPDYCDGTTKHVYQSVCGTAKNYEVSESPCFSGCESGVCKK